VTKPVLLDLFCCAGGAARGYQRAGFHVIGVDVKARPNYCGDEFIQADAAEFMSDLSFVLDAGVSLIHWSPPCQANAGPTTGTNASKGWGRKHVDMIPIMRPLVEAAGLPYVLEQPMGKAPMRRDLKLCMDMFKDQIGKPPFVFRHRQFEFGNWARMPRQPVHVKHDGRVRGMRHGVNYQGDYVAAYGDGGGKAKVHEMQHALGIDWTAEHEELIEAIPPAYTEYIGLQFLASRGV
jgi:hypothetical protein